MLIKKRSSLLLSAIFLAFAGLCYSQTGDGKRPPIEINSIKSSPAYAEILLRKTEIEADLVSFSEDYTDTNPKVIDAKFELALLTRELDRLFGVRPSDIAKLTEAAGKLIVRHAALETELNRLQRSYNNDHPQVKRARRKAEYFAAAVKEILG